MNFSIPSLLGLAVLFLASCSGGGPDALRADFNSNVTEWLEVAETVDTAAELEKAKPKLEAISLKIETIKKKVEALSDEDQLVMAKAASSDAALLGRLMDAQMRLMRLETTGAMGDLLNGLGQIPAEFGPLPGSPSK